MADAEAPQEEKPQDVEEKPKEKKTIGKLQRFRSFCRNRIVPGQTAWSIINGDRFFVRTLPVSEIMGKVRMFKVVFVVC